MLKEKISYANNLPVNLLVAEIEDYPIHFHDEIEVVFILEGKINLRNGYYNYKLKEGDIFILNAREIHSFTRADEEKNMVMMFQLNVEYFSSYYENLRNSFFVTDMDDDDDEGLEILRKTLGKIMVDFLEKGYRYEHKVLEGTHNLIMALQSDFQYFLMEDGKFVNEKKKKGNKILAGRLNRITEYMYDNYYRKLTLNEIADREHLSIYYLSHVIKEATGLSFQDLLSFIRVEESEKLVLGTNKKVGAIAEETGFSAVRYYIKHFKQWYGMHPLEYREKYAGKVVGRESSANLRRCNTNEIEGVLRGNMNELYEEVHFGESTKPVIIDLPNEGNGSFYSEPTSLDRLFHKNILNPITGPYRMLKELQEEVISEGINHIITRKENQGENENHLSILLYNFDSQDVSQLSGVQRMQEVYNLVKASKEQRDYLLRISGMTGNYKVYRYRLPKENCLFAFKKFMEKQPNVGKRKELIDRWLGLPRIEINHVSVIETMSLHVNLKGISAELILIEKESE